MQKISEQSTFLTDFAASDIFCPLSQCFIAALSGTVLVLNTQHQPAAHFFRCHHCLSDDFRAHEFRTISLNIHALQLNYPEKYDTAAKYMAGLVSGWDKKGVEVKVNVDSLMKMCETAANPPFEGKRPLTRPQLAAGYMFLEAVPQSKVGKGLDATQLSSISQSLRDGKWLKGEMTESNKGQFNDFGSENQETARKGGSKRSKR